MEICFTFVLSITNKKITVMNYLDLSVDQKINFKSWCLVMHHQKLAVLTNDVLPVEVATPYPLNSTIRHKFMKSAPQTF